MSLWLSHIDCAEKCWKLQYLSCFLQPHSSLSPFSIYDYNYIPCISQKDVDLPTDELQYLYKVVAYIVAWRKPSYNPCGTSYPYLVCSCPFLCSAFPLLIPDIVSCSLSLSLSLFLSHSPLSLSSHFLSRFVSLSTSLSVSFAQLYTMYFTDICGNWSTTISRQSGCLPSFREKCQIQFLWYLNTIP